MTVATARQSYLPKAYCWNGRTVQAATAVRPEMLAFLHAHPLLRVFSGYRMYDTTSESDHLCGFALDLVPLTQDAHGKAALQAARAGAVKRGYPYVEFEWTPTNKHLHISFRRCGQ